MHTENNSGVYWANKLKQCCREGNLDNLWIQTKQDRVQEEYWVQGELLEHLKKLSKENDFLLFTLISATYTYLLSCYFELNKISMITPAFLERVDEDTETNLLLFQIEVSEDQSLATFLKGVRAELEAVVAYQEAPTLRIFKEQMTTMVPEGGGFKVFFIRGSTTEKIVENTDLFHYPIAVHYALKDTSIQFTFSSSIMEWEHAELQLFTENFIRILKAFFGQVNLNKKLKEIVLLSAEEYKKIIPVQAHELEPRNLIDRILEVSRTFPERVALQDDHVAITYDEMRQSVERIASFLRHHGVTVGSVVGFAAQRSANTLLAIYGILKSGATFFPLSVKNPPDKIKRIMADIGLNYWLDLSDHRKEDWLVGYQILEFREALRFEGEIHDSLSYNADWPLYLVYTSGTTGFPKGVLVAQKSILNRLWWQQSHYSLGARDTVLHKTPLSFDVSIWEVFWPMMTGSKVYVLPEGLEADVVAIMERIQRYRVSVIHFVPTMMEVFFEQATCDRILSLKQIYCSGEVLFPTHVQQYKKCFEEVQIKPRLTNLYGPTEAAIDVSYEDCLTANGKTIPIGKPIWNTSLYVVDHHHRLLPPGIPGQLGIGGTPIGSGYLNRPYLNCQKYQHLGALNDERVYLTGDKVCVNAQGLFEFKGRYDDQVKLRGQRIELEEIKSVLLAQEGILQAAATMRGSGMYAYLEAYCISDQTFNESDLKQRISKDLPGYMVPSFIWRVEKFPLSLSGKLDLRKLIENHGQDFKTDDLPTSLLEKELQTIWQKVLKKANVGVTDNYFYLGGNSVNMIRMLASVHYRIGANMEINLFFQKPTIRQMAQYITETQKRKVFKMAEKKAYYDLSVQQKRIWVLHNMNFSKLAYNISFEITTQQVAIGQIQKVLAELTNMHESLRSAFLYIGGKPRIKVLESIELPMKVLDIADCDEEGKLSLSKKQFDNYLNQPFDLAVAGLWRVLVIKENECLRLYVKMHHIIGDGWSSNVLQQHFQQLLSETNTHKDHYQYTDFSEWQHRRTRNGTRSPYRKYWLSKLENLKETSKFPGYRLKSKERSRGSRYNLVVDKSTYAQMSRFCKQENVTLFTYINAVFSANLSMHLGLKDISYGVLASGRNEVAFNEMVGLFVNTLIMRTMVNENRSFSEHLKIVNEETQKAFMSQDYPLEVLLEEIHMSHPKVNIAIDMLNISEDLVLHAVNRNKGGHMATNEPIKYDVMLYVVPLSDGIELQCLYNYDIYDRGRIQRTMDSFVQKLTMFHQNPEHEMKKSRTAGKRRLIANQ